MREREKKLQPNHASLLLKLNKNHILNITYKVLMTQSLLPFLNKQVKCKYSMSDGAKFYEEITTK